MFVQWLSCNVYIAWSDWCTRHCDIFKSFSIIMVVADGLAPIWRQDICKQNDGDGRSVGASQESPNGVIMNHNGNFDYPFSLPKLWNFLVSQPEYSRKTAPIWWLLADALAPCVVRSSGYWLYGINALFSFTFLRSDSACKELPHRGGVTHICVSGQDHRWFR